MRWYAVHTLSGSEDKARQALEQRIEMHGLTDRFGRVLVPSETVVDPKTKRKITRRFYPGYMLVEMELDNETWYLVKNTPKVTGFVGGSRNPPPVDDEEVRRITAMLSDEEEAVPRPVLDFELGEEVRLTEGSYASMRGTVEEINEQRGKLRVKINIFGRPVSTELGFHQVEKLS
ncbi:MAG: transcription termination/antitermination protein NusG [Deltaproteobacteria bacterium]|nr:MAG: transcription termination/antitermination protein NusG [Deltaproteobacteria bacterium]